MTDEFRYIMNLSGAAATGTEVSWLDKPVDWLLVCQLAEEQTVQHLVAYALKKASHVPCPVEIRKRLQQEMRVAVAVNSVRMNGILVLLDEMKKEGFHPVLLKGYALANYYAAKDCRISSDADVWINAREEKRAYDFLNSKGFQVQPRNRKGHHAVCYHPDLGLLELHVLLYDEIVEEVWFGKMDGSEYVQEEYITLVTNEGAFETLGYTDNLIFIALHMVKHFILGGISLRMILDMAVYFSKNKDVIDAVRFWNIMQEHKYSVLINCVLGAAIRYCGFRERDFPGYDDSQTGYIDAVLDDLEAGGWLGSKQKEDRSFDKFEYNRQKIVSEKSSWYYRIFMFIWKYGNIRLLFPERKNMVKKYPYLLTKPWMFPYAWLHRLFVYGTKALRNGALKSPWIVSEKKQVVDKNVKNRHELFRQLGMM